MKGSRNKNQTSANESWTALGMEPDLLRRIERLAKLHDRSQVAEIRYLIKKEEKEEGITAEESP